MKGKKRTWLYLSLGILIFALCIGQRQLFTRSFFSVGLFFICVPLSLLLIYIKTTKLLKISHLWAIFIFLFLEIGFGLRLNFLYKKPNLSERSLQFLRWQYFENQREMPVFDFKGARYDSTLFYLFKPGIHSFSNSEFSTTLKINRKGFRDDEKSLKNPEMIFLGDSHTMGWGVEISETFVSILEKRMELNSLNLGVPSFGTAREFLAFKEAEKDSCQFLIIQYCSNDDFENQGLINNNFSLKISSKKVYRGRQFLNFIQKNYYPGKFNLMLWHYACRKILGILKGQPKPSKLINREKSAENFFRIIGLIREQFKGKVIVFNLESHRTGPEIFHEFSQYLSQNPMPDVFVFPAWRFLTEREYFRIDDHINSEGHKKIAAGLYDFMVSLDID